MADARTKVQEIIKENAVVVFSKSYCPYCRSTKDTLNKLGAEFKAYELDKLSDGADLQDALEAITGQRTVPNVHIKQQHIGGNSDLQDLNKTGKLEGILKDAGALKA
ncbi:Glutaredoxin [Conoideocrella luteorostrata]|uniref:Glutaredoxin n=1 Tax=Conoideocrella luteorostrata TaxID=1105319 RepID=A0AAJ0CTH3_9HYPO|nr:Glutaredoxin [Conoideocrella luteorostrata]